MEVNDDWVDGMVISYVMDDIEGSTGGTRHFYWKDNGQAMVLFFLDRDTAAALNELSGNALQRVTVE